MRFEVLGFPVSVHPGFGLTLLASGTLMLGTWPLWAIASWWAVMFGAILLHELGHAAAARSFGLPVRGIRLHALGGDTTFGAGRPAQQLVITLAGPLSGVAAGLAVLFVSPALRWLGEPASLVVSQVVVATIGWSLFNLLPIRPLDGGNALLEVLTLGGRPGAALSVTHRVGMGFGALLAAYAALNGMVFLVLVAGALTYGNYAAWRARR